MRTLFIRSSRITIYAKWVAVAIFIATALLLVRPVFSATVEEGFSTDGSAQRLILNTIAQTKPGGEICIAAFAFTNKTIADALIKAADKGVRVGVVVDSEQAAKQYSSIPYLVHAGISVRVDDKHFEMHNKFMVVDLKTVQTGSFNYTSAAAKHNAENVIVIHEDSHLVEAYLREWKEHWNHSKPAQFRD